MGVKARKKGEEYIAHYGIKGQRWGVRRSQKELGGNSASDHKTARKLEKKGLHKLSNDELQVLNQRLNLENQYITYKFNQSSSKHKKRKNNVEKVELMKKVWTMIPDPTKKKIVSDLSKSKAFVNAGKKLGY